MGKTILGFTYDEEDFNYFTGDKETWRKLHQQYNDDIPMDVYMSKGSYCGAIDRAPEKYKIGISDYDGWRYNSFEVWWNLDEPITKEEYEKLFMHDDLGDGDWYMLDKIIKERNLPYEDNIDLQNKNEKLYDKLWKEAFQRLLDEDYERYIKLWHESKQAYLKWLDNVYRTSYINNLKVNDQWETHR